MTWLSGLARAGDVLWAFGFGDQVYSRTKDEWSKIDATGEVVTRFVIAAGRFDEQMTGWFCGSITPPLLSEEYTRDPVLEAQMWSPVCRVVELRVEGGRTIMIQDIF